MTEILTQPVVSRPLIRPTRAWVPPTLVGIAAAATSLISIDTPSIWYDEAATVSSATRSWSQLAAELGQIDLVHGLYYALMHVWFDLVGYSPFTLRLPSALAVGAAAALLVILGRHISRERLGVAAGIVFAVLPRATWAGGEGRSYALTALLAVATTLLLVLAARRRTRGWWIAYAVAALVACTLFIYLALVIAGHLLTLALLRRRDARMSGTRTSWLLAMASIAPLALPFVIVTISQRGQVAWLPEVGTSTPSAVVSTQWFFDNPVWTVLGWAAIVAGVALMATRRDHRRLLAVVLPGLIIPTAAILIASATITPLYNPRYLTMSLPFVALAIAAAIDALPRRGIAIAALALAVAISIPTIVDQRQTTAKEDTDWRTVSTLIENVRSDDPDASTAFIYDSVRHHPRATSRVIAYAYPQGFGDSVDVTLQTSAAASGKLWETFAPLTTSLDRLEGVDEVFLLTSTATDDTDATLATIGPRGWRITDTWTVSDVKIVRFAI
ncbi:glycosyltransferase family 39 protein [soil metagenome]